MNSTASVTVPFIKRYQWEGETEWSAVELGSGPEEEMYTLIAEAYADGWEDRYTPYTFAYIKELQREIDGDMQYMQISFDPYQATQQDAPEEIAEMKTENIEAYRYLRAEYEACKRQPLPFLTTDAQLLFDLTETAWDNAYRDNLGSAADLPYDELGPYNEAISNQVFAELMRP